MQYRFAVIIGPPGILSGCVIDCVMYIKYDKNHFEFLLVGKVTDPDPNTLVIPGVGFL